MKKLLFYILILNPYFLLSSGNDIKFVKISPVIDSVQLYSDQAMVVRKINVSIKKSQNHFVILDLPDKIIDDSVMISVENSKKIKIQKIEIKRIYKKIYKSLEAKNAEKYLIEHHSYYKS